MGMSEKGKDRCDLEYERSEDDFNFKWIAQDNAICDVCHGIGAKVEFSCTQRDYASDKTRKICKTLQTHKNALWICPTCMKTLMQKQSIINTQNLNQPMACHYCGGYAKRRQLHYEVKEGENRYANEHHEDGSLKWTFLECNKCGRSTTAFCYEYQATDAWNRGKTELRDWNIGEEE